MEGLECPKRVENIINRKIINFYIEAMPKFFSQLRKKIFFSSSEKNLKNMFEKKILKNVRKKSGQKSKISNVENLKCWHLRFSTFEIFDFCPDFFEHFSRFFFENVFQFFFELEKNIFFFGVEIFFGIASMYNFLIFRFMMFSERLEYGKYDFQHLQGTVRVQKPVEFRGISAKSTVFAVMPELCPPFRTHSPNFEWIDLRAPKSDP